MRRGSISITAVSAIIGSFLVAMSGSQAYAAPDCQGSAQGAISAQDEYAALELAAACRSRVEVLSETDEMTQVFANPDGTQTMESYATPQRVRKDGIWKAIDTELQRGADGRFHPKASGLEVSFSSGGEEPFVVSMVDGRRFELSWPEPLASPTVHGDSVTYPEVLPGVDLAVRATRHGFTHVLVVRTAQAAANPALARVRYHVSGEVSLRNTADGGLELVDAAGKVLSWGSGSSEMWDSALDPQMGGETLPGVTIDPATAPKSTVSGPSELAHVRTIEVKAEGSELYVVPDVELLRTGTLPIYIDPPFEPMRSTWVYATKNNGNRTPGEHARVGDDPGGSMIFRSFFTFPVGTLYTKQVLSAYMYIRLDHNSACAGNTAYAYRTPDQNGSYGSRVAWSPSLQLKLDSAWGDSNETGACGSNQGDDWLVFGNNTTTRNDVQSNANSSGAKYTIGLCMCSSSSGAGETGSYQWMKFHHDTAKLVTNFNSHPGTPTNLTTSNVACGGTVATYSPVLKAQYIDADGSDWLTANFEWKEASSSTVHVVTGPSKQSGNYGDVTVNLGSGAEGKSYTWRVITRDANSPNAGTSSWCDFTVNAGPPPAPGVSSSVYPSDGVAHGGPGVAASFTFTNGGTTGGDITSYVYGWTDPPTNVVNVAAGDSVSLNLTPPRFGYNTLHVFSREPSLSAGPTKHYQFLVNTPSAPVAHWPLDEINAVGFNAAIGPNLSLESGRTDVTWSPDVRYIGSNSAGFDIVAETPSNIAGVLTAPLPSLDTSAAFSIAAWVRPSVVPTGNMIAVGKDGTDAGGFYLGLRYSGAPATPKWAFAMKDTSASTSTTRYATSPDEFTTADVGKWVHLVGSFDPGEKKLRLYLNGVLVHETASGSTPWNATGEVTVGRSFYNGGAADLFKGHIADVRVWNRVIVGDDLQGTDANAGAGTQAVPGILQPVQVGTWDFSGYDAIDGSYWGRHMTAFGNATFVDPGHDNNGALSLDGTNSYAEPSTSVLRTDNSLTVSAWVKVTAITAGQRQVVMRQSSDGSSALKLEIETNGLWVFSVVNDNGDGTYSWKSARSNVAATAGTWVHLIGVFDLGKHETRLYVDGVKQTTKGTDAIGHHSTQVLQVGYDGGAFFNGEIDQVKVYSGAMNDREASNLYNS